MKKVVSLLMVLMMIFVATSCSEKKNQHPVPPSSSSAKGDNASGGEQTNAPSVVPSDPSGDVQTQEPDADNDDATSGINFIPFSGDGELTTKRGTIVIKAYSIIKEYDEDILVYKAQYTNNSNDGKDHCFSDARSYIDCYQDSIDISFCHTEEEKEVYTDMKQGVSLEIISGISLRNTTSDVLLEVKEKDNVVDSIVLPIK